MRLSLLRTACGVALAAAATAATAACTFDPQYPIQPGAAPGAGAGVAQPRYPIDPPASTPTPQTSAPATAPVKTAPYETAPTPPPTRAPVEETALPPPSDTPAGLPAAPRRPPSVQPGPVQPAPVQPSPVVEPPLRSPEPTSAPVRRRVKRKPAIPAVLAPLPTLTVESGDTLYSIARRVHSTVPEVASLNGLKAPYALHLGQTLKLPPALVYVARKGDSVSGIAKRFGVDVAALREANPSLGKTGTTTAGDKLELPPEADDSGPSSRAQGGEATRERKVLKPAVPAVEEVVEAPAQVATRRGRRSRVSETSSTADAPRSATATSTPLRAAPAFTPPPAEGLAAAPPPRAAPSEPGYVSPGPRSYASVFGGRSGRSAASPDSARPARDRSGRTAEDARAAAAAAAQRDYARASLPTPLASAAPSTGSIRFAWPVSGEVISGFGPKGSGLRNDGLDLAAGLGDPVKAAAAGEVVYAGGAIPGFGNLVLVKHPGGWVTAYGHLSRIGVAMRQSVRQGDVVGDVGQTGNVDRPELHFEIRFAPSADQSAKPVDPTPLLPKRG